MDVVKFAIKIIDSILEWKKMFILSLIIIITGALNYFAGWPMWLSIGIALFICSMILLAFEIRKDKQKAIQNKIRAQQVDLIDKKKDQLFEDFRNGWKKRD